MDIEESKRKIFNNIRRLREQSGWSQEELAERSGVPLEILEQLERNVLPADMMVSDAYKLAKAFCCKTYELFL